MAEPTKEAMGIAYGYMTISYALSMEEDQRNLALAIDDHTQALHTENALLRERLRLAVEALETIAVDPPVSESPTIESILNRAQRIARAAIKDARASTKEPARPPQRDCHLRTPAPPTS